MAVPALSASSIALTAGTASQAGAVGGDVPGMFAKLVAKAKSGEEAPQPGRVIGDASTVDSDVVAGLAGGDATPDEDDRGEPTEQPVDLLAEMEAMAAAASQISATPPAVVAPLVSGPVVSGPIASAPTIAATVGTDVGDVSAPVSVATSASVAASSAALPTASPASFPTPTAGSPAVAVPNAQRRDAALPQASSAPMAQETVDPSSPQPADQAASIAQTKTIPNDIASLLASLKAAFAPARPADAAGSQAPAPADVSTPAAPPMAANVAAPSAPVADDVAAPSATMPSPTAAVPVAAPLPARAKATTEPDMAVAAQPAPSVIEPARGGDGEGNNAATPAQPAVTLDSQKPRTERAPGNAPAESAMDIIAPKTGPAAPAQILASPMAAAMVDDRTAKPTSTPAAQPMTDADAVPVTMAMPVAAAVAAAVPVSAPAAEAPIQPEPAVAQELPALAGPTSRHADRIAAGATPSHAAPQVTPPATSAAPASVAAAIIGDDRPGGPREPAEAEANPVDIQQPLPTSAALPSAAPVSTASPRIDGVIDAAAATSQGGQTDQVIDRHLDLARDGQWLDRLARDISQAATQQGHLKFHLNPERLGALTIEIANSAAGAAIHMTTETDQARAIIADAQPQLIAEVRAQGLRVAEARVDVNQNSNGGSASAQAESGQSGQTGQQRQSSADHQPFARTQAAMRDDAGDSASQDDGDLYA